MRAPLLRAAGLLVSSLLIAGGCSKDGKSSGEEPRSASESSSGARTTKGGSSAPGAESRSAPGWSGPEVPAHLTEADLARYPAPVPVQTVARAKEIPTLPPQDESRASATEANSSVKVSLLGVAHT